MRALMACLATLLALASAGTFSSLPLVPVNHITTRKHVNYGLQDWSAYPYGILGGTPMLVDCIGFNCVPGCELKHVQWPDGCAQWLAAQGRRLDVAVDSHVSKSRRRLAHTSGGPPVQVPMPDVTMTASDPCDFTTVLNPSNIGTVNGKLQLPGTKVFGVVTYAWVATCILTPRSGSALTTVAPSGMSGLIIVYPFSLVNGVGMGGSWRESNPVPDVPIVLTTGCVEPLSPTGQAKLHAPHTCMPDDEHTLFGMLFSEQINYRTPGPWRVPWAPNCLLDPMGLRDCNITNYVNLTADSNPVAEAFSSPGSYFLFILWGLASLCVTITVIYTLIKKKVTPWTVAVLVLDGFGASLFRAFRCFFFEPLMGTDSGNMTDPFSVNFAYGFDLPFATTTTLITAGVWLKAVTASSAWTAKLTKLYDIVVALGALGLFIYLMYQCLSWPLALWTGSTVGRETVFPMIYLNMAFAGFFVLTIGFALFKIFRATKMSGGTSSVLTTIRKMLKWIVLQLVGIAVFLSGMWPDYFIIEENQDMYSVGYNMWVRHGTLLGGTLASIGQVGTLLCSSSSSK